MSQVIVPDGSNLHKQERNNINCSKTHMEIYRPLGVQLSPASRTLVSVKMLPDLMLTYVRGWLQEKSNT